MPRKSASQKPTRVKPVIEDPPPRNNADDKPAASPGLAPNAIHDGQADPEAPSFTVELVGDQLGQTIAQIVKEAQYWVNKGRYNKVRIVRAGKPVLPDIPVGALIAVEAATFFYSGLLRSVLANVAGKVLFEVQLINDAKEHLTRGRALFLSGDLDEALNEMQAALAIDARDPEIHVALGSLLRAMGDREAAIAALRQAFKLDPEGPQGEEARRQLLKLGLDL